MQDIPPDHSGVAHIHQTVSGIAIGILPHCPLTCQRIASAQHVMYSIGSIHYLLQYGKILAPPQGLAVFRDPVYDPVAAMYRRRVVCQKGKR